MVYPRRLSQDVVVLRPPASPTSDGPPTPSAPCHRPCTDSRGRLIFLYPGVALLSGCPFNRFCTSKSMCGYGTDRFLIYIQHIYYAHPSQNVGRSTSAATKSVRADWQRKRSASMLRAFATAASMPPYANPLNEHDFCCTKPHFKVLGWGV